MIYRWLIGVAPLFAILLLMWPNKGDKSVAKIASVSMLACTQDYRDQVREKPGAVQAKVSAKYPEQC